MHFSIVPIIYKKKKKNEHIPLNALFHCTHYIKKKKKMNPYQWMLFSIVPII